MNKRFSTIRTRRAEYNAIWPQKCGASLYPRLPSVQGKDFSDMWKPTNQPNMPPSRPNEPERPAMPASSSWPRVKPRPLRVRLPPHYGRPGDHRKIVGHQGEVTGSESLYIDGRVEGSINLAGNRVTVGRNGVVSANINAREIVVLGKVRGNLTGKRPCRYPQRWFSHRRRRGRAHLHRRWRVLQGRH